MEFNFTIPLIGMDVDNFIKLLKDNGYEYHSEIIEKQFNEQIDEDNKQAETKQLVKHDVMQRSEQLIAFCDWYKTTDFNCEGHSSNDCVDEYLKSN